ncbi:MAG: tRNA (guanosine(37)-N1)-methyltransferase TrmD [Planctomycetes bacterium]|nr:tRNA (guanosine(37)-N1)-methyltransferase TrmD [Planctomycetota bacterium]
MRFDVITLFPEAFGSVLASSIVGRALREGLVEVVLTNLRDFAADKRGTVDDKPFGGGPGMVLLCEPMFKAVEHVRQSDPRPAHVVLLTPQGRRLTQGRVRELAALERLVLVCGHYEGFDERIRTLADEEVSIGDYVLTGGELPAMVLIDSVTRLLPGALGAEDGTREESFSDTLADGGLEYPQYTRPRDFRGMAVPEILVSGNHAAIARWRDEQARARTLRRCGDLAGPGTQETPQNPERGSDPAAQEGLDDEEDWHRTY